MFSAEVSTCDAILFMLATSLSQDLYKQFVNPAADDRTILLVARLAAIAGGAIGVLLAILLPTVIGALSIFYTLLGVSLFIPVLAGLYVGRAGMPEAFAAIVAGVSFVLAVQLSGQAGRAVWTNPNVGGYSGGPRLSPRPAAATESVDGRPGMIGSPAGWISAANPRGRRAVAPAPRHDDAGRRCRPSAP